MLPLLEALGSRLGMFLGTDANLAVLEVRKLITVFPNGCAIAAYLNQLYFLILHASYGYTARFVSTDTERIVANKLENDVAEQDVVPVDDD